MTAVIPRCPPVGVGGMEEMEERVGMGNKLAKVTHRPEDRNATELFRTFDPDGATLADLEEYVRVLRQRGAPDDAHPRIMVNEHGEVIGVVCVTEREDAWRERIGLRPR